jgi:hypothetical protein
VRGRHAKLSMGLLEKINPKATVSSVIHQALVGGIIGAVGGALIGLTGYCFAMPDRRSLTDYWPHLVGLTLVGMFVWAVFEWQVPEEAIDLLDLVSRLERCFSVRISREELSTIVTSNEPRDITVADLFDFIRGKVLQSRVLDSDLDANALWPIFQRAISDALGVEPEEVTKEKGLNDLGATWFL